MLERLWDWVGQDTNMLRGHMHRIRIKDVLKVIISCWMATLMGLEVIVICWEAIEM